jgi:hypothetical protein
MWSYVSMLAMMLLAVLQLAKDWGAHKTNWRRASVVIVIVLIGIAGAINLLRSNTKAYNQHTADQKQIAGLQHAVETANRSQEANTKIFVQSFQEMTQKLSGLETRLKTVGLQKEAAQLKKELESTRKALDIPKSELVTTLGSVTDKLENLNVTEAPALLVGDTISVTLTVFNKTDVQAKRGSIFVRICKLCTFAEEPARFRKIIGAGDYDREMVFDAIPAKTAIVISLKIRLPLNLEHRIEVDVTSRCENCAVLPMQHLFVNY